MGVVQCEEHMANENIGLIGRKVGMTQIFNDTEVIPVTVIQAGPGKVHIDGLPYDEFVQILEGRLILTLDDGRSFEFEQGDSLVVPKGYVGSWEMPEPYRELVVIDTETMGAN